MLLHSVAETKRFLNAKSGAVRTESTNIQTAKEIPIDYY